MICMQLMIRANKKAENFRTRDGSSWSVFKQFIVKVKSGSYEVSAVSEYFEELVFANKMLTS